MRRGKREEEERGKREEKGGKKEGGGREEGGKRRSFFITPFLGGYGLFLQFFFFFAHVFKMTLSKETLYLLLL
jgi:hypothetical protein